MQSGDKSEKVLDAEEERLTNALVKVTRAGNPVIYVVKGHGERDISSAERIGLSQAKEQMEKANYTVKDLELARTGKVPADAAVVIVPGPKNDLLPPELLALDEYLAQGGRVLFMADPLQADRRRQVPRQVRRRRWATTSWLSRVPSASSSAWGPRCRSSRATRRIRSPRTWATS